MDKIILASKSKVRKAILNSNGINCDVIPSNVDEDAVKISLNKENASPEIISKNLAELKANKVSAKYKDHLVLGADSVIDLNGSILSKPSNRAEALGILKSLNDKSHHLISSVCISKGGNMIWNYTDKATLTMKNFLMMSLSYIYQKYQMKLYLRTMFIKLKVREENYLQI